MEHNTKSVRLSREHILKQIAYENASGEHTFSMCRCGRKGCRGVLCVLCWEDKLRDLNNEGRRKK